MDNIIGYTISVFMGFFAIVNPIGNIPIFLGLVDGLSEKEKKTAAWKSVLIAFIIVVVFIAFGSIIFKLFGITIDAFKIAGGILIFIVGYSLVHGENSRMHHPGDKERKENTTDVAISPLAIPILAGPGTISTALSFVASGSQIYQHIIVAGVFAVNCLLLFIAFRLSERIMKILNPGVIKIVTRLMGLILTIIAVQMVVEGVKDIFK